MGKAIITIIVTSIIASVAVLIGLDLYATENLQFQTASVKPLDWADLSIDMLIAVCNPTFMPTSIDKIQANIDYKSTDIAGFTLEGSAIAPHSKTDMNGRLSLNGGNVLKIVVGGMLSAFSGQTSQYDPNNFSVHLKLEKRVLWFIPYSYEKDYPVSQFTSFIHSDKWDCEPLPPLYIQNTTLVQNFGNNLAQIQNDLKDETGNYDLKIKQYQNGIITKQDILQISDKHLAVLSNILSEYNNLKPPEPFASSLELFKLSTQSQFDSDKLLKQWIQTGDNSIKIRSGQLLGQAFDYETRALDSYNKAKVNQPTTQ